VTSPNTEAPRVQSKLADFGLSVELQPGEKTAGTSTRRYTAPEVVARKGLRARTQMFGAWGWFSTQCCAASSPLRGDGGRTMRAQEGHPGGKVRLSLPAWEGVSEEAKGSSAAC